MPKNREMFFNCKTIKIKSSSSQDFMWGVMKLQKVLSQFLNGDLNKFSG